MPLALTLLSPGSVMAQRGGILDVESRGQWTTWWRADSAPARWPAALPVVRDAVVWHAGAGGIRWGTLRLSGSGEAWRVGVVLIRFDPARVRLTLTDGLNPDLTDRWTIDSAPAGALAAVNAGQFEFGGPWGWVVREGLEHSTPGGGPLAATIVADATGHLAFVPAESVAAVRRTGGLTLAFQSFPAALVGDGEIPRMLREPGHPIDLGHRDARLAIGELRDGSWIIALTRFEGLGGALDVLPFGLTTPETAALLGALGCRRAVLLDGGVSGQLMVKDSAGVTHTWHGLRKVPLGLVILPKP